MFLYWSKLHAQSLKEGDNDDKITPSYSLVFTEFSVLKEVKDFISCFSIRRDKEPYILFNRDLKIVWRKR
ncbi:MAG: PD-(D/E)XK nuclease family transposase [Bdellovibrionales bacterium]|nr:PD-(D/E)XK nuclease family transposase [Bdellovibrionales bacterium]